MTYQYNNFNNNNARINALTVEDYAWRKKLEATAAWWHPTDDVIYVGEQNMKPTWDEAVIDVKRYRENMSLYRQGKISQDRAMYNHWLSSEWENEAQEQFERRRARLAAQAAAESTGTALNSPYRSAAGGVVTSTDSPAVNVIQILAEVMGIDKRQYSLEQAVDHVSTPNLVLSIDQWHGFSASSDVGEGVEALVKKGEFTREDYLLKKDVAHIMVTDESIMRNERDVWSTHVNHAVQDMKRLKAQKIAVEMETATDVAGADWGARTGGISDDDPIRQLGGLADLIELNGGDPNSIASHPRVFRDFASNTHVTGSTEPVGDLTFGNRIVTNVPGLPGVNWYIDALKTNTLATVYDKSAIKLMQGPVRTAQYRIEGRGLDAYITRDFNLIKIVDSSAIRDLTGVSA